MSTVAPASPRPRTPVVGVTCYREPAAWGAWRVPAAVLPEWYLDACAGREVDGTPAAFPVAVVLLPPPTPVDVLDRLDGLVLVGGADVDARRYGCVPHPTADVARTVRDASELALYLGARERGLPVLGICRGLQVMAVAHGGTLHQHLPDLGLATDHRPAPAEFSRHHVRLAAGSQIANVMGATTLEVNSSHHQAVADPGSLTVTGWAEDGTIEVCEDPAAAFCIGVQWHPEHPARREVDAPLLAAFRRAAVAGAGT